MVREIRWLRSWAYTETEKFQGTSAPRISDGSSRWVVKIAGKRVDGFPNNIDGERVEGLSYKLVGEHVAGLSRRKVVKNELKDSWMLVKTAVAGRRTAGTWCGLKEVERWMATMAAMETMAPVASMAAMAAMDSMTSMATMATMASMASMASMAPMAAVDAMASRVAESSLNRWSRLGLFVIVKKMVLCASEGVAEARNNTKVNGLVSMMCWDMTFLGNWLCPLTVLAPKANFGSERSRSSRRVDEFDGEHPEGLPSTGGGWAVVAASKGALTWKSPCVLSGEGGTHRRRLVFLLD